MLSSSIFASSADLEGVATGTRRILAPEVSDTVALVQQALLAVAMELPKKGVDTIRRRRRTSRYRACAAFTRSPCSFERRPRRDRD
jgi:hypothetical protein